jgi:hypothetical protein
MKYFELIKLITLLEIYRHSIKNIWGQKYVIPGFQNQGSHAGHGKIIKVFGYEIV